jgi:predicted nucleic acid-binding protein
VQELGLPVKILLDVPLEGLAKYLEHYDHEVYTATKENVRPDEELIKYASENGCVLVIEDKQASRIAKAMGIRVVKVDMQLIADRVQKELSTKYPGVLESYADELFSMKIGESIRIPMDIMGPLLEGQKGGPLSVTRRAFRVYINRHLRGKKRGRTPKMSELLDFRTGKNSVIVTKRDHL